MVAKIQVIFTGMYGHVYQMAAAVASGAREAGSAKVTLWQVPELVPDEILEQLPYHLASPRYDCSRRPLQRAAAGECG